MSMVRMVQKTHAEFLHYRALSLSKLWVARVSSRVLYAGPSMTLHALLWPLSSCRCCVRFKNDDQSRETYRHWGR